MIAAVSGVIFIVSGVFLMWALMMDLSLRRLGTATAR